MNEALQIDKVNLAYLKVLIINSTLSFPILWAKDVHSTVSNVIPFFFQSHIFCNISFTLGEKYYLEMKNEDKHNIESIE